MSARIDATKETIVHEFGSSKVKTSIFATLTSGIRKIIVKNIVIVLKYFAKLILWLAGWKIIGPLPAKKSVVVMAPHTSNLDFLLGWLGYTSVGLKSHFLIKKEVFKWYSSRIIKGMGGIPVDRSHSSNVVMQVTEEFNKRDKFIVTITPEGTRRLNRSWKRGFYFIAYNSNVPIMLGFLDYKRKEGGFGFSFIPSGDYEKDYPILEKFYLTKTARYPEKFNLTPKESI